jgi:hypothetical protein
MSRHLAALSGATSPFEHSIKLLGPIESCCCNGEVGALIFHVSWFATQRGFLLLQLQA